MRGVKEMALRRHKHAHKEIKIFDEAVIYKRGDIWHFRLWLTSEQKYVRKSLQTNNAEVATSKAKDLYLSLYADQKAGKSYYSLTVQQGVERYLKYRESDVAAGLIVKGRLETIRAHLAHWVDFLGKNKKLMELSLDCCVDYFNHRINHPSKPAKQVTIQNEQSTINACVKYLFKKGLTHISELEFKKLPKLAADNEAVRRATFTNEEYKRLHLFMRRYCSKRNNELSPESHMHRQLMRYWILIAANSGLRPGEQRQLRWSDVDTATYEVGDKKQVLARIRVRAATTKVRKGREFDCRRGELFDHWKKIQKPASKNDLIFSINGKEELSKRTFNAHFHKILDGAGIVDVRERKIVPYSLRHFMITQRVMSGLSYGQIAAMCGTSAPQVENTYYHLNDEMRRSAAVADYTRTKDGIVVPTKFA